ncbi:MAG: TVP38/TMEM64 family protein [Rhodospirillaceae bacterium]|nr:TVP38/TMEM64 family protein [Rhodospirillaceae bacterium]MBT6828516.1 TVP38/TMEM64 family protein [Rhodospirillaceae bacterium]
MFNPRDAGLASYNPFFDHERSLSVPTRFNPLKGAIPAPCEPAPVLSEPAPAYAEARARFSARRLAPAAILVAGIALFFALGLHHHFSFDTLRQNRAELLAFVTDSWLLAGFLFLLVYAATTAFSLPWCSLLTLASGFLFGPVVGTVLAVIGATAGAFLLFTIAKSALGDPLRARAQRSLKSGALQRIEAGFQANALSYLLFLRLAPIFPFFIVNLLPAFLGVRPRTYLAGTFFGIIPGTFVFCLVGSGLGNIFERGEEFSLENVLSAEMLAGLVALALLSMIPVAYKFWRKRAA